MGMLAKIDSATAVMVAQRALVNAAFEAPVEGLAETIVALRMALWEAKAYRDAARSTEVPR